MVLLLSFLCDSAPYTEEVTYRRSIVRLGYPVEVREDYSLVVAGRKLRNFRRVLPSYMGRIGNVRAYDNTSPVPISFRKVGSGVEITLKRACLPVGKHRITLEYALYPEGDTLTLNILNGDMPVPIDYVEVVIVPDSSSPRVIPPEGFRLVDIPGFNAVRCVGDGPFSGDGELDLRVVIDTDKGRGGTPLLLLLLVLFLLRVGAARITRCNPESSQPSL